MLMPRFPIQATLYRPTRVSDGAGGFTESMGTGVTIWCACDEELYSNEMTIRMPSMDIKNGNVISFEEI